MKKLSDNVQNLIGASSSVRTFKTAIAELVYNSLDANSTSIAIRVDIQENLIQVIDNGCGIPYYDFNLLGQKHATSKFVDTASLKSAPCKYGFRGQALARIIKVSKHVKITSRCEQSEETGVKHFHQGKTKDVSAVAKRPSKGTTVDIRGFLFNLSIQKRAIDALKELCDIKSFLEQISLVHNNISISLRDDTKNEIVFQIHKKRELFQTLKILYGINKDDLQELHVEKNKYKVSAYIEKLDQELKQQNWIYLNGKFICDSQLHKIVNSLFSKMLSSKSREAKKVKSNYNKEDKRIFKKKVPFYIFFISCPFYDYDINFTKRETNIEFKSWDNITNLVEKLIKFYIGDVKLNPLNTRTNSLELQQNTRDEVKKIMNKILGSHTKKLRVSQMQNGIKGRLIKRKPKKKSLKISKPLVINEITPDPKATCDFALKRKPAFKICMAQKALKDLVKLRSNQNHISTDIDKKIKTPNKDQHQKSIKGKKKKHSLVKNTKRNKSIKNKRRKSKIMYNKDPIISRFKNEDGLIKRNCKILSKKVEKALHPKKQCKQIFVNETVQYSNIVRNNKNISVRQQIEEIVIHEYMPRNPIGNEMIQNDLKSNYDLFHTVLKTQQDNHVNVYTNDKYNVINRKKKTPEKKIKDAAGTPFIREITQTSDVFLPQLTFESHRYEPVNSHYQDQVNSGVEKSRKNEFISKQSIDNFNEPRKNIKMKKEIYSTNNRKPYFRKPDTILHRMFNNKEMSAPSYDIDFSQHLENHSEGILKSQGDLGRCKNFQTTYTIDSYDSSKVISYGVSSIITNTYTRASSTIDGNDVCNGERGKNLLTSHDKTYTLLNEEYDNENNQELEPCYNNLDRKKDFNVVFLSKSQNENNVADKSIDPLDICASVLGSNDIFDEEFDITFNDNDIQNDSLLNVQIYYDDNNDVDNISHHFNALQHKIQTESCIESKIKDNDVRKEVTEIINPSPIIQCNIQKKCETRNDSDNIWDKIDFNFKNRPRFLPKGMSPIFKNCQTKTACKNFIDEECFADKIYDYFANEVQTHTEMFSFVVQNVTDVNTKDIEKVNHKMHKDNASLTFNGGSLKTLQVMGQVDDKFIAAKIEGKTYESQTATEFLVLFDQHAVHERVRLESNMADYFDNDKWQSVEVDDVLLKLSKDQIMYLHNYKDKFTKFGLQWTVFNSEEVIINAIPKAVLGKNPRQVEKIITAIKNLIGEEIETINNQMGCITLFPKAIMDLVFSEACRYAIKFGDRLSKANCIELLEELSQCKTPFQCAHGRPVMAVLMEIESQRHEYKIDVNKVISFIKK